VRPSPRAKAAVDTTRWLLQTRLSSPAIPLALASCFPAAERRARAVTADGEVPGLGQPRPSGHQLSPLTADSRVTSIDIAHAQLIPPQGQTGQTGPGEPA
jgi:hypothetical protein